MNCGESFYIHIFQRQNTLIDEQKANDLNPLYSRRHKTDDMSCSPRRTTIQYSPPQHTGNISTWQVHHTL